MLKRTLVIGAVAIALSGGQALAQSTIKFANYLPPRSVGVSKVSKPWIEQVKKELGDAVKFKEFWGGSLGRSPFKQYKLVIDGVADIAQIGTHYVSGQWPDNSIMELPFLLEDGLEGSRAMWRFYKSGNLRGYGDVKVLGMFASDLNVISTRKAIKSLADMKGLKVRASGAIASDYLRSIGAVPVSMAVRKITESIDRGVIDGVLLSWAGVNTFRVHNIAKYHIEAPFNPTTFTFAMNKKKWESLPANVRAALDKLGGENLSVHAAKGYHDIAIGVSKKLHAEDGRSVLTLADDALAKAKADAKPLYDKWAGERPNGAKKLAAMQAILADLRAGK